MLDLRKVNGTTSVHDSGWFKTKATETNVEREREREREREGEIVRARSRDCDGLRDGRRKAWNVTGEVRSGRWIESLRERTAPPCQTGV